MSLFALGGIPSIAQHQQRPANITAAVLRNRTLCCHAPDFLSVRYQNCVLSLFIKNISHSVLNILHDNTKETRRVIKLRNTPFTIVFCL